MVYPQPPFTPSPQPPATAPPSSFPAYPPWQYGYPRAAEPTNSLLTAGAALAMLGGLLVGIGWLLFGPGIGLALLGLGKQRLSH